MMLLEAVKEKEYRSFIKSVALYNFSPKEVKAALISYMNELLYFTCKVSYSQERYWYDIFCLIAQQYDYLPNQLSTINSGIIGYIRWHQRKL